MTDSQCAQDAPVAAPIGASGSGTALAQPGKQPHPTDPHRWADGTVRAGNALSRKSGLYSHVTRTGAKLEAFTAWAAVYGGVESLSHEMRVILWELADTLTIADTAQEYIETSAESLVAARKQKAIATKNAQQDRLIRLIPLLHSLAARQEQRKPTAGLSLQAYLATPEASDGSEPT